MFETTLAHIKFYHTKHDEEQFAYDPEVLGKIIGMENDHILECFKD